MKIEEGASVAIVGPSETISCRRLGREIDSFDYVIKLNLTFILDEADYGSKCDLIVYSNSKQKNLIEKMTDCPIEAKSYGAYRCTTGFKTIKKYLRFNPKIFGFSFYKGKNNYPKIYEEYNQKYIGVSKNSKPERHHPIDFEYNQVKNWFLEGKLDIDQYLKEIFNNEGRDTGW